MSNTPPPSSAPPSSTQRAAPPNSPPRSTASFRPQPAAAPSRPANPAQRPPNSGSAGASSAGSSTTGSPSASGAAAPSKPSYATPFESSRETRTETARQSSGSNGGSPTQSPTYPGSTGNGFSGGSPSTGFTGTPSFPAPDVRQDARPDGRSQTFSRDSSSSRERDVRERDSREREPIEPEIENYRPSPTPTVQPAAPAEIDGATPRVARLTVASIHPLSALKMSFLLSVAAGIALVASVVVLWMTLNSSGVFDKLNDLLVSLGSSSPTAKKFDIYKYVGLRKVVSISIVIAVINSALLTAIATLSAVLYNLSAGLVGGVRVTLSDD